MTETAKLGLPFVQAAQSQKHVTVNDAMQRIDSLTHLELMSLGGTIAPTGAVEGDTHFVGAGATGEWLGQDGQIAVFANGGWLFVTPRLGWQAFRSDTGVLTAFDGEDWVDGGFAFSPNGAGFVHRSVEVDHSVSAGATSVVTGFIPANSVVYGITGRVLSSIGGAASLEIGVSGSSNRYGSGIGLAAGAWARGLTGNPLTYYSATDVVLTATGGTFDGSGAIRLVVHVAELALPRA